MKKINLFCLTFAGGNKYSYRFLSEKAPSFLNLITLEYPGRGARMREELISDINLLVDDLYYQIKDKLVESYAFYGHSMGGLFAYLLTLKILQRGQEPPRHLFITGTTGPSAASRLKNPRHLLDQTQFVNTVRELGGMPGEILDNEELLAYLEPILRNDFKTIESYKHVANEPLNIPFTVITGTGEDMEMDDIILWQNESKLKVDFQQLPGKHFFILEQPDQILKVMTRKLEHFNSNTYE